MVWAPLWLGLTGWGTEFFAAWNRRSSSECTPLLLSLPPSTTGPSHPPFVLPPLRWCGEGRDGPDGPGRLRFAACSSHAAESMQYSCTFLPPLAVNSESATRLEFTVPFFCQIWRFCNFCTYRIFRCLSKDGYYVVGSRVCIYTY